MDTAEQGIPQYMRTIKHQVKTTQTQSDASPTLLTFRSKSGKNVSFLHIRKKGTTQICTKKSYFESFIEFYVQFYNFFLQQFYTNNLNEKCRLKFYEKVENQIFFLKHWYIFIMRVYFELIILLKPLKDKLHKIYYIFF